MVGSCAKNINFLVFCHYFDENHMKDLQMKKEIELLLRPMTKTSQLNDISGNSKEDVSDAYSVPNGRSRCRVEGVFT